MLTEVKDFDVHHDLRIVNKWLKKHKAPLMSKEDVPEIGLVFPDVLMGFLYQTDASFSFLENFVSNPEASRKDVSQAIDHMSLFLLELAREKGKNKVFAFTKKRSILNRAKQLGFKMNHNRYDFVSMEVM